jgi:hypothetical protein
MRIIGSARLLWALPLLTLVSGFPGTDSSHKGAQAHQALHKRCPYASTESRNAEDNEKRFLVDSMMSPIDGMWKESMIKQFMLVTKQQ